MDLLVLPIFPEGALAHSVTTCVWIGVMIIGLFNLRFGWVMSGLVVPGYLAPLIFVKPWSAGVVVFEALVTYLLAYWFSERGSRLGYWSAVFGRDRFFSLILISVIVRLIFDTWLLPDLAVWLEQRYEVSFDFRNNLHSFGLIIICLLANQFWKTGIVRGLVPVAVPIILTCLVIRFILMEFTNFSIGNLNFIYEDVAASLMASPKSYMILILAAFIASRMNLHYGWDYNGILIPALLALQWYQPEKVLTSFIEALIILLVARGIMRLPWLAQTNLEGARKLLLFFNISFFYKFCIGWVVLVSGYEAKSTDYFGFGYLLTTLIAVKMHDKEIIARLSRATLQTSLTAVISASVLAFALSTVNWEQALARDDALPERTVPVKQAWQPLAEFLEQETLTFYQHRSPNDINKPLATEIDRFSYALQLLDDYRTNGEDTALKKAAALLHSLNFDVIEHADWLLLKERQPTFGWGTYVLAKQPKRALTLQVPAPLESGHLSQIGAHVFNLLQADSLALAGNHIRLNQNQAPLSTMDQTSLFHAFHRHLRNNDVLQLRGAMQDNRSQLGDTEAAATNLSELRIATALPRHLDLQQLNRLAGAFDTYFQPPNAVNIQRSSAAAGFGELFLTDDAIRTLLYASIRARRGDEPPGPQVRPGMYLREWLDTQRALLADKHSNTYRGLTDAELLYFDEQILQPMLRWTRRHASNPTSDLAATDLSALDAAAGIMRHRIQLLQGADGQQHLALRPGSAQPVRHSALLVMRVGAAQPYVLQVPRPLSETGTMEAAADLYEHTNAHALIIHGAHYQANIDETANALRLANKNSVFSLASQHLVRAARNEALALVQLRGLGYDARVAEHADVLLWKRPAPLGETPMSSQQLQSYFSDRGLRVAQVDGSWPTWGYENQFALQGRYLEQSLNKTFWTVWVPRSARLQDQFAASNRQLLAQLTSLGLAPAQHSLQQRLLQTSARQPLPADIQADVLDYQATGDVVVLRALLDRHPNFHFESVIDRYSQQIYLLAGPDERNINALFLLGTPQAQGRWVPAAELASVLPEFVTRGESWLLLGDPS